MPLDSHLGMSAHDLATLETVQSWLQNENFAIGSPILRTVRARSILLLIWSTLLGLFVHEHLAVHRDEQKHKH
jgi:hypothetical protein